MQEWPKAMSAPWAWAALALAGGWFVASQLRAREAARVELAGLVQPLAAADLDRILDVLPSDVVTYSLIRHPVPLITAMASGLATFNQNGSGDVDLRKLPTDWGARAARVVAEDGFQLNRGFLLCQVGDGPSRGAIAIFAARHPRALEHVATALGVSSQLSTNCRAIESSPDFIACADDLARYRPERGGAGMHVRLRTLLPKVRLLEAPHVVYFSSLAGEEGAVAFFLPPGPMMRPFGMGVGE